VDSQEIIKIVVTSCHILRLRCTKFDFGWGFVDSAGAAYSAPPDPLDGFQGPTSKGREWKGTGSKGERKEGRCPQFEKNDPLHHQMAGYGPVITHPSSSFGIHGSVLKWFKSYLSSHSFCVKCDEDYSSEYVSSGSSRLCPQYSIPPALSSDFL